MRRLGTACVVFSVLAALTFGSVASGTAAGGDSPMTPNTKAVPHLPLLRASVVVGHLALPWDVQQLPGGAMLISERDTHKLILRNELGVIKEITGFPQDQVWSSFETGLMGLEVDPDFAHNRRIYTCYGANVGASDHDIRVVAWRLNPGYGSVTFKKVLLSGVDVTNGRHEGCRLLISKDGALVVSIGDAQRGTNPQDLTSYNGKTLRLNRISGAPWPANPFIASPDLVTRYILTYGHRNPQGLAQRTDGTLWSIEQGTDRDDEVNKLVKGGNMGFNPVATPPNTDEYDPETPMTDHTLPGTVYDAEWTSGFPTLATSGGTFVHGAQWGEYNGTLAVAALKSSRITFMKFDKFGKLLWTFSPDVLHHFGRMRSVTAATNGDLLITTSNNDGQDKVLRVRPQ